MLQNQSRDAEAVKTLCKINTIPTMHILSINYLLQMR